MENSVKRFLSLALALVMVLSNVPFQAFATDDAVVCEVHAYEAGVCTVCEAVDPDYALQTEASEWVCQEGCILAGEAHEECVFEEPGAEEPCALDENCCLVNGHPGECDLGEAVVYATNSGTWGGIDWELSEDGTLTIAPTKGTPTTDNSGKWTYEDGQWPEAVVYNKNGGAASIGGWPYDRSKVTKLVIEEGVTSIGSFAAQSFTNLTGEVVIPSTVIYIGQEAFQKSTMTKLTFAAGGTEELCIAQGAFKNLILEEIVFPSDRPVHIHAWNFLNSTKLKHVTFPAALTGVTGTNHVDYNHKPSAQTSGNAGTSVVLNNTNKELEALTFSSEENAKVLFEHDNAYIQNNFNVAKVTTTEGLITYCKSLAVAAKYAKEGDTITLLKDTNETVEIPVGIALDLNGFTADNVTFAKVYVAQVGETKYETLAEAIAAANAGDIITLLAGNAENVSVAKSIVLALNGKSYTGTITLTNEAATLTVPEELTVVSSVANYVVKYNDGVYGLIKGGTWGGIDWTLSEDGTLTISPTKGEPVPDKNAPTKRTYEVGEWRETVVYNKNGSASAIGGAPYDMNKVKKLIIEEGVTKIGSFTAQFPNLTGEVVIPSTVTYIGQEAFHKAPITKLTFAADGTAPLCIANGAFKKTLIEEVAFPGDREYIHIHHWAFGGSPNLKTAYIPANVTKSWGGEHVDYFDNFNSQSNVTWAEYGSIFTGCTAMETITFETEAVRDLFFEKGRQSTDEDYIVAYTGLIAYKSVEAAVEAVQDDDDVALVRNVGSVKIAKSVTLDLNGKTVSTITLTDKTVVLTAPADLNVVSGVENHVVKYSDGKYVLIQCGTWGGIDWTLAADGTLIIAPTAGTPVADPNCGRTYEVGEWPEGVVYHSSGDYATAYYTPYDKNDVKALVIEDGVTTIGSFAVKCPNLTGEVVIPASVNYVGQSAFQNAPITKLTFAEGGTEELCIAVGAFEGLKITELKLPERAVHMHAWAFQKNSELLTAELPNVTFETGSKHVKYWYYGEEHASGNSGTWDGNYFAHNSNMVSITFGTETGMNQYLAAPNNLAPKVVAQTGWVVYFKNPPVFLIGKQTYNSLEEALDAAKKGDTIVMLTDAEVSDVDVEIPVHITLDLNGHNLTAKSIAVFGKLIDSEDGVGSIQVVNGKFIYSDHANSGYFPLLDKGTEDDTDDADEADDVYRLFKASVTTPKVSEDSKNADIVKYYYRILFDNKNAYLLLEDNVSQITFYMNAYWTGVKGVGFKHVFSEELLVSYAQAAYKNMDEKGRVTVAMSLEIIQEEGSSHEKGDVLKTTPVLTAPNNGVIIKGKQRAYILTK